MVVQPQSGFSSDDNGAGSLHDIPKKSVVAIVDDDDSVRSAMSKLLRLEGYEVHGFATAADFLKSSQIFRTQCLVSDIRMPGSNGLEFHARLLALGHHIPTIFMTGFPENKSRERALAAGARGFLIKPFDGALLIQLIEEALGEA
ncbi:response regulator transcription factor [Bordetella muralis]|jgi:FixJ family two-component response regulator|uniref:response regulator transcription factor n=1 Tax=Bordetella muralis TaxID=1649130 RepID=UPI0039F0C799